MGTGIIPANPRTETDILSGNRCLVMQIINGHFNDSFVANDLVAVLVDLFAYLLKAGDLVAPVPETKGEVGGIDDVVALQIGERDISLLSGLYSAAVKIVLEQLVLFVCEHCILLMRHPVSLPFHW